MDVLTQGLTSFELTASLATLLTGFLFGMFVVYVTPTVSNGMTPPVFVTLILALFGLTFFTARAIALYLDGNVLWPRNIGFALLWLVYCCATYAGLAVRRRWFA